MDTSPIPGSLVSHHKGRPSLVSYHNAFNEIRQVTEGDLNEGPTATGGTSLSNVHSESTDSGIQSVGDVTESSTREPRLPLSLVHRIFGGKITTSYICLDCHTESLHQDFFTDLHLAFPETADSQVSALNTSAPQELTLESLLSYYLASEKLQGDNRYHFIPSFIFFYLFIVHL